MNFYLFQPGYRDFPSARGSSSHRHEGSVQGDPFPPSSVYGGGSARNLVQTAMQAYSGSNIGQSTPFGMLSAIGHALDADSVG